MGRNRWANRFPATCYKCGARLAPGDGRLVTWRAEAKQGCPMRVQCFEHTEAFQKKLEATPEKEESK